MNKTVDVATIIVGLNAREYVLECLRSLSSTEWSGMSSEIIYVDNGSQDDSARAVAEAFPAVQVIANSSNVGFCKACNQGARAANARYLFFLNDDTVVYPDTVPTLARFLENNPQAGVAGSRLLYPDLTEQWSARRFPSWQNGFLGRRSLLSKVLPNCGPVQRYLYKRELQSGAPFPVDWVPGSCTMVRPDDHRRAGGFPEDLHYWSDALFCLRIAQSGKSVYLVPASRLIHYEGKGSGARTFAAERWHIIDFHRGAFKFHCERYQLQRVSPRRWITGSLLAARAAILITFNRLVSLFVRSGHTSF